MNTDAGKTLSTNFQDIKNEALANFKKDNYEEAQVDFSYYADLRYMGQEHYVKVKLEISSITNSLEEVIADFHKEHQRQFTFQLNAPVELVNYHLVAEVEVDKPDFPKIKSLGKEIQEAIFDKREVDFDDLGKQQTSFYRREDLDPGMTFSGPAIIAEKSTTTVVTPKHQVVVDEYGNLILTL